MSIERKCETCERGGGCGLSDCRAPDWSHHFSSRAALEAEVERLGVALGLETNRCRLLVDKAADERALSQKLHDEAIAEKLLLRDRMDDAIDERDAAISRASEERVARARYRRALLEANRRRRAERTRDTSWSQCDDPEDL